MEKGSLRCDANVSVRKLGAELGTRCEIKNINSIRNITRAIDYEANRQVEIIESGGKIDQETRLFDASLGVTRTMRSKEDAHDYRYFPDPDLLPLVITQEFVDNIRSSLPELPNHKKARYVEEFGLSKYDASVLVADRETSIYFEEIVKNADPKIAANWITAELFARLNKNNQTITESKISPAHLQGLITLIGNNTISGKIAKQVFDIMFETGQHAKDVVEEHSLQQVTNTAELEQIVSKVLDDNQDKVLEYKSGKDKLFGFFVGQIMKVTAGKANPEIINELLKKQLEQR